MCRLGRQRLTQHRSRPIRWLWLGSVTTLVASCGERGDRPPAALDDSVALIEPVLAGSAGAHTLEVTATDFAFDAVPRIAAGAVTLRIVNRGTRVHHAAVFALDEPGSLDAFFSALRRGNRLPAAVRAVGATPAAQPGQASSVLLVHEPGEYLIVCLDTGSGGEPHVIRGMVRSLVVTTAGTDPPGR